MCIGVEFLSASAKSNFLHSVQIDPADGNEDENANDMMVSQREACPGLGVEIDGSGSSGQMAGQMFR